MQVNTIHPHEVEMSSSSGKAIFKGAKSKKLRLRKRHFSQDNGEATTITVEGSDDDCSSTLPLNHMNENAKIPKEYHLFPRIQHSQLHRNNNASSSQQPIIMVQHSCLLIPVFVAAWWFWTKRKARAVISGLLHHSSHDEQQQQQQQGSTYQDVPDDFSTWDEVVENESQDPSVHFVRWIKANDSYSTARRRAYVRQASRRTLQLLNSNSDLSEAFVDEDSSILNVDKQHEEQETGSGWQCLEDAHGIELCPADSQACEEMENIEDKAWSYVIQSESRYSDGMCTP